MSLKDKSVGYYLAYSPGLTPSNLADDSTHAFIDAKYSNKGLWVQSIALVFD